MPQNGQKNERFAPRDGFRLLREQMLWWHLLSPIEQILNIRPRDLENSRLALLELERLGGVQEYAEQMPISYRKSQENPGEIGMWCVGGLGAAF